jgi:hypothetical protein
MISFAPVKALTEAELIEWNKRAEAKRAADRAIALKMIGRQEDGTPFPSPDEADEQWLRSADLRAPLRQAHAERRAISLRRIDAKDAQSRAEQHLNETTAALAVLGDAKDRSSREASRNLAEQFRSGTIEAAVIEAPDPAALEEARHAVTVAQQAFDRLAQETKTTQAELIQATQRVGYDVLAIVRAELLRLADEIAAHSAATNQLRADLEHAGIVLATLQARRGWRGRIFTTSMNAALYPAPPERLPPVSRDWQKFIARLFEDPEAALE